ncbi:hypothetical protein [Vannielia sp. SX4]|uniref:hypothetical protein n=1 Tax=Vannielia sp. SX4 TaxID=3463852 RepID=UPI004059E6D7
MTVNTYDHANKLFNLRKGLPIAAMTSGIGNFGASSISTISKDLRALLTKKGSDYYIDPTNYTMEQVATLARRYFFEERFSQLDTTPTGNFQYWIGGYSSGADLGEIWRFQIDNGTCDPVICDADKDNNANIGWGGAPEAINRLILGYSQTLGKALAAGGMPNEAIPQAISEIGRFTQVGLANPAMPTTDAVDLARFLAETTKQFVRFQQGSNSVGGSIDIATITKHENFKWVDRKHFYSPALNPLETDHA